MLDSPSVASASVVSIGAASDGDVGAASIGDVGVEAKVVGGIANQINENPSFKTSPSENSPESISIKTAKTIKMANTTRKQIKPRIGRSNSRF